MALCPQDLYVYISEHEHFTDFNVSSALFWQKRDLVYGDWSGGDNADGCYEHYGEVDISQVWGVGGRRGVGGRGGAFGGEGGRGEAVVQVGGSLKVVESRDPAVVGLEGSLKVMES